MLEVGQQSHKCRDDFAVNLRFGASNTVGLTSLRVSSFFLPVVDVENPVHSPHLYFCMDLCALRNEFSGHS